MNTMKIDLADEDADALKREARNAGLASSSDLPLTAIGYLIAALVSCNPDALAWDVAAHEAAKRRGDVGFTPQEARAWLAANRPV